jgi:hypothetical protein
MKRVGLVGTTDCFAGRPQTGVVDVGSADDLSGRGRVR